MTKQNPADPFSSGPVSHGMIQTRRMLARLTRGFTLTELMVAMSGGLMIAITVFLMARQASRFYQRELRSTSATLTNIVGFERLRVDIARAGFMASPNIRQDPAVCGGPVQNPLGWQNGVGYLSHLQSIFLEDVPPDQLPAAFADNGRSPKRITMSGNYTSAEQFEVRDIADGAVADDVFLSVAANAVTNKWGTGVTEITKPQLDAIFGAGRAVRIVDTSGQHYYAQVITTVGGAQPRVTISRTTPPLRKRSAAAKGCGLIGTDKGAMINVVNIVRYDLRDDLESDTNYAALYSTNQPHDGTRADLIREELDVDGEPIPETLELVAEYAVDLDFELTGVSLVTQRLETVGVAGWADDTSFYPAPITGPQKLRAVEALLSVRSREADRDIPPPGDAGAPFLRFGVGGSGSGPYARVRTLKGQIALNNQLGITW